MAVSINWATKVITVPQADLPLVSGSLYELDIEDFRLWLKDIEDSEDGMAFPDTHRRNAPVTLAGATYAQTLEIINGYTITFEATGSPWTARVVGGNHNIGDVKNVNHVSLIIGNSAGLIVLETGTSGLTPGESAQLAAIPVFDDDALMARMLAVWQRLGLDPANPLVTNEPAGTIVAGGVNQTVVESPAGVVTITQAP